jgi:hypothetical protein
MRPRTSGAGSPLKLLPSSVTRSSLPRRDFMISEGASSYPPEKVRSRDRRRPIRDAGSSLPCSRIQGSAVTPHHFARYSSRPGVARAHPLRPGSLLLRRLHDFFDLSHAGPNVDRSLRGFRTCRWQLKHRRLLAFHPGHQEQDVAIRKLQGFVKRVEAVYIDLPVRTPFCGG